MTLQSLSFLSSIPETGITSLKHRRPGRTQTPRCEKAPGARWHLAPEREPRSLPGRAAPLALLGGGLGASLSACWGFFCPFHWLTSSSVDPVLSPSPGSRWPRRTPWNTTEAKSLENQVAWGLVRSPIAARTSEVEEAADLPTEIVGVYSFLLLPRRAGTCIVRSSPWAP